jgi:signal transduction histidine kinase
VTEKASTDFEMRGLHKNGDILYLLGRSKPVVDLQDQQVILGNIADISKRRLAEEEILKTEEELRILSAQLMSAEERERKRIASDIHDSIGQALSAIKFSIENALNAIPAESFPLAVEALQNIIPLTQEAIEEVRRIIMDLRPSILDDLGLIATISWFCREFETIFAGIRIEKELRVEENDIAPALKTVIYRILQEALNNAAKHSRTNLIRLQLRKDGDNLELQIEDRGQGFNIKEAQSRDKDEKGMGLTSMKERAQLSGGVFNIQASPGKGTIILISWPLEAGGYKHVRETAG